MRLCTGGSVYSDGVHASLPRCHLEDTSVSTVEPSVLVAVCWAGRAGTGDYLYSQSQEGSGV